MTEYVITIRNGDYPLTYRTGDISEAFLCLVTAEKWHHLNDSPKFLDRESLMEVLVSMKAGKTTFSESGEGYKIEVVHTREGTDAGKEAE